MRIKKIITGIAVTVTGILLFALYSANSSGKVYLKKAGADELDDTIRMHFPAQVNYQKSESEDLSSVSAIRIKQIRLNDTIRMDQSGTLALSGRVAAVRESEIFGIHALKVYLLYGKKDCSDFITRHAKPYKLGSFDSLFPSRITSPRHVNYAVLTILEPNDELRSLKRGDYLSVLGDWGNIHDNEKSLTAVSQHGVYNFYILLNGCDIKHYEPDIFKFRSVSGSERTWTSVDKTIVIRKWAKELTLKISDFSVVTEDSLRTITLKYTYTLNNNGEITTGSDEQRQLEQVQINDGSTSYSLVQDKSDQIIQVSDISFGWSTLSAGDIYLYFKNGCSYSLQG
ncbi:hypothetical protein P4C99_17930 [Pontiellaceae bacterium B1224]|nr:hypothetical protein [Pontiellaceae bacterium B1224]